MRELMESANLTPPTFNSDRARNQFIVTCLFHHFLSTEDWAWLRSFGDADLCSEEARALVYAREIGAVDNATYRHLNRVDVLNASTHLRRLRDRRLLEQKGKGSETYYIPTERLLEPWRKLNGKTVENSGLPSQLVPGDAQQSGMAGSQSSMVPPPKPVEQTPKPVEQTSKPVEQPLQLSDLPPHIADSLRLLMKKAPKQELRELILDLCGWRPFSSFELAQLLSRNQTYLLNEFLGPLVVDGALTLTIPEQPTHPEQRYRTTVTIPEIAI